LLLAGVAALAEAKLLNPARSRAALPVEAGVPGGLEDDEENLKVIDALYLYSGVIYRVTRPTPPTTLSGQ
jgi:hypothetical protein